MSSSIKEVEEQLGQFSDSIPFILAVQKNDGSHITADNFSPLKNQVALIRVLNPILRQHLLNNNLQKLIQIIKEKVGDEKFGRILLPTWFDTQKAYDQFDISTDVVDTFHRITWDLEGLISTWQIKSFMVCVVPNNKVSFFKASCKAMSRSKSMINLLADVIIDYGRFYNFDPVLLLENYQLFVKL